MTRRNAMGFWFGRRAGGGGRGRGDAGTRGRGDAGGGAGRGFAIADLRFAIGRTADALLLTPHRYPLHRGACWRRSWWCGQRRGMRRGVGGK